MYMGRVHYQGICGSCYIFATLEAISGLNAIEVYGFSQHLSVQQVLDCADNPLTYGCNGGFLEGALAYVQIHGVVTEDEYPYDSEMKRRKGQCARHGGPFTIRSFSPLP